MRREAVRGAVAAQASPRGEALVVLAHQERKARYRLDACEAQATQAGGGWKVSGDKSVVPAGDQADAFLVPAQGRRQDRAVPGGAQRARACSTRGYRTQDGGRAAEVALRDAAGHAGHRTTACRRWNTRVDIGIACTCAEAVGVIDKTMQLTAEYMNTRKQFGVTLATFQALRHRMADMKMQQELARSMSYYASLKLNAPADERRRAMARAKYQLGVSMRFVGQNSVQLHGGIGVTDEYMGSHYFRKLTQLELTFGDTLHHLGEVSAAHAGHGGRVRLTLRTRTTAPRPLLAGGRFHLGRNDHDHPPRPDHPPASATPALARRLRHRALHDRHARPSSSCTATATPPRSGRRRSGASSPTAGRASACTRSTCPTRWRATTTRKPQPGRTSTAEHMAFLKAEVEKVLQATGAPQVVLVANSRGGYAVRNYIQNGGGDRSGEPRRPGRHAEPRRLARDPGPAERQRVRRRRAFPAGAERAEERGGRRGDRPGEVAHASAPTTTTSTRSRTACGSARRGQPTGVTFAGPELKGATNVVMPRVDHRETSFSPAAFAATYRFITGRGAAHAGQSSPEQRIVLSGKVTRPGPGLRRPGQRQLPQQPAAARRAAGGLRDRPRHRRTARRRGARPGRSAPTGRWGPFDAQRGTPYEFVVAAPGYATTHIYRSPFPRSSACVHMRPRARAPRPTATRRRW